VNADLAWSGMIGRVRILSAERPGRRNGGVTFLGRWDATAALYALAIVIFDVAGLVIIGHGNHGRASAALGDAVVVAWFVACLTAGFRKTPWAIRLTTLVLLIMLVISARVFVGHDVVDAWANMGLVAVVEVVLVLFGRAGRRLVLALRNSGRGT